jgi:hypothetical protein
MRSNHSRTLLLAAAIAVSGHFAAERAEAQGIHVDIGIPLPSISFSVAPQLVALPGTYAYVVPEYDAELFFYDGFWWRPYQGRWYRSSYYDRGWEVYGSVPVFYSNVPRDWRTRYRNRSWDGRRWDYERVSYDNVKRNWSSWKRDRHWDRTVRDSSRDDYRNRTSSGDRRIEDRDRRYDGNRRPDGNTRIESGNRGRQIESGNRERPMQSGNRERQIESGNRERQTQSGNRERQIDSNTRGSGDPRMEQRQAPVQRGGSQRGPARTTGGSSKGRGPGDAGRSGGGDRGPGGGKSQGKDGGKGDKGHR